MKKYETPELDVMLFGEVCIVTGSNDGLIDTGGDQDEGGEADW